MPDRIINAKLYADRTVQDWHRTSFPSNHTAIDIDLMGYCAVCRKPVYFIESTTNPNKPTSVLHATAITAYVPAAVIVHQQGQVKGGRTVYPNAVNLNNELDVRNQLVTWRRQHMRYAHPNIPEHATRCQPIKDSQCLG